MKRFVALALLAACQHHGDDYPIGVGGPGGPGGGNIDAPTDTSDTDTGNAISARVCLAADPRQLEVCASSGAGSLTVALGSASATTADDGTFSITPPEGSSLLWNITGTNIVTSVMPYDTQLSIPAFSTTTFSELESANGILPIAGTGSIFVRVVQAGAPLASAVASATPAPAYATLYDGASATAWNQNHTGAFGVAWVPGAGAGTASVSVTPSGGTATPVDGISVIDGGVTFVTADIP